MINERKQSQLFELTNPSIITPTNEWIINLEQSPYNKYNPFNNVNFQNNSSQDTIITIDDFVTKTVPAGTIFSIDQNTIPNFRSSIKVKNIGIGNISVDDFAVSFQKINIEKAKKISGLLGGDL